MPRKTSQDLMDEFWADQFQMDHGDDLPIDVPAVLTIIRRTGANLRRL